MTTLRWAGRREATRGGSARSVRSAAKRRESGGVRRAIEPAGRRPLRRQYGYEHRRSTCDGVVRRNGVRPTASSASRWTLRACWADVGREPRSRSRTECGRADPRRRSLLAVRPHFRRRAQWPAHAYKVYVLCEPTGAPAGTSIETARRVLPLEALPELSFKTPAEHLERVLAIARIRRSAPRSTDAEQLRRRTAMPRERAIGELGRARQEPRDPASGRGNGHASSATATAASRAAAPGTVDRVDIAYRSAGVRSRRRRPPSCEPIDATTTPSP